MSDGVGETDGKLGAEQQALIVRDESPNSDDDSFEDESGCFCKSWFGHEREEKVHTQVPEKYRPFDWACMSLMAIMLILLISYIIFISATWNKDRTNEYT